MTGAASIAAMTGAAIVAAKTKTANLSIAHVCGHVCGSYRVAIA